MRTLSGDLHSRSLCATQHVNIIIPDTSEDFWTVIDDEIRVLYLLHRPGSNADERVRFSMIEAYAKIYDLAVIMPDGNRSFYQDMETGPCYFDWIAYELPSIVHEWFRLPQNRAHLHRRGEHGGYGGLRIALGRPDAFAGCAALSSVIDPQDDQQGVSRPHVGDAGAGGDFRRREPDGERSHRLLCKGCG